MNVNANEFKNRLVEFLSDDERILGIGQTGDMNAPLVPGKSDIDMFVLCTDVPSKTEREEMYRKFSTEYESLQMEVCGGGIWGYGDIFMCGGIDVMPMYFTVEEMQGYLEEFLDHFLQALYAKNDCYFPSRKRTEKAIAGFKKKPDGCYERLLKIVELAAKEGTIEASVAELRKLGNELKEI